MHRSIVRRAAAAAAFVFLASASYAQEPVSTLPQAPAATVSGQVRHASSLKPIPEVPIIIEGTALVGVTDREGRFSIANVPAGTHHVVIAHPGFVPLRPEVTVAAGAAPPVLDVLLSPSVHYTEVVSVSPDAR